MTPERLMYLAVKDEVEKLPEEIRTSVDAAANGLKATMSLHGDAAYMALALVAAEFAAQE